MLVLTRNIGEVIQIGDDIRVIVKDAKRGRARLVIDAPKSLRIIRAELEEETKGGRVSRIATQDQKTSASVPVRFVR